MANNSLAQQFSGIPMDGLIGGPLQAVADANSKMAAAQTKFLIDTCFNTVTENIDDKKIKGYKPIMISMVLSKPVINSEGVMENAAVTKFEIPLLTILPINSLGVTNATIDFEMEVKSSSSEDTSEVHNENENIDGGLEGGLDLGLFSVSISGKASYSSEDSKTHDTHYENSNSSKYTVHVEAAQLPIPKGINTIIDVFSQSIEPIVIEKKTENPDGDSKDKKKPENPDGDSKNKKKPENPNTDQENQDA